MPQRAKCEQQATFRRGPDEVRARSPSSESNMVPLRCQILLESHFASRYPRLIKELTVADAVVAVVAAVACCCCCCWLLAAGCLLLAACCVVVVVVVVSSSKVFKKQAKPNGYKVFTQTWDILNTLRIRHALKNATPKQQGNAVLVTFPKSSPARYTLKT